VGTYRAPATGGPASICGDRLMVQSAVARRPFDHGLRDALPASQPVRCLRAWKLMMGRAFIVARQYVPTVRCVIHSSRPSPRAERTTP